MMSICFIKTLNPSSILKPRPQTLFFFSLSQAFMFFFAHMGYKNHLSQDVTTTCEHFGRKCGRKKIWGFKPKRYNYLSKKNSIFFCQFVGVTQHQTLYSQTIICPNAREQFFNFQEHKLLLPIFPMSLHYELILRVYPQS